MQWDYKKGEVEVYDKRGRNHKGGFDPKDLTKQISKVVVSRIASGYGALIPFNFPVCRPCIEWFFPQKHLPVSTSL